MRAEEKFKNAKKLLREIVFLSPRASLKFAIWRVVLLKFVKVCEEEKMLITIWELSGTQLKLVKASL